MKDKQKTYLKSIKESADKSALKSKLIEMFKHSIDKSFTCFNVAKIHQEEFEKSFSEFKAILKTDKKAEVEITSET